VFINGCNVTINRDDLFQMETDAAVSESSPHIANIGRLVEDMENKIRNTLNDIYFGKTKDIVNGLRSTVSANEQKQRANLSKDLASALEGRNKSQQSAK